MQLIPDRTLIQFIIMRWLFQMIRLLNMSRNSPFDAKKPLKQIMAHVPPVMGWTTMDPHETWVLEVAKPQHFHQLFVNVGFENKP